LERGAGRGGARLVEGGSVDGGGRASRAARVASV